MRIRYWFVQKSKLYDYSFIIYVVVWLNGRHFLLLTGQKTKIRTEKSVSDSQQMYHFKA